MLKNLRNSFFAGLILLAPLWVTVVVARILMDNLASPASDFFFGFLDIGLRSKLWVSFSTQVLSLLLVLAIITFLGYISKYLAGKFLIEIVERFINKLPFINTVYGAVKQIVDTVSKQNKAVFQKTVLVQFPKNGTYSIGFITGGVKGEMLHKTAHHYFNVFVPTSPNPTGGFLIIVPKEEIIELDMSVAEGMKLIISLGAVIPPFQQK